MDKWLPIISQSSLFLSIEEEDILPLLRCLQANVLYFPKGSYIWNAGEQAKRIGIVLEGRVQIVRDNVLGDRTILTEICMPEMFGEAYAYNSTTSLPVSVIAKEDSSILFLDSKKIIKACPKLCQFHYQITENLLNVIIQKNIHLNQKNEILSSRSTQSKILTYLSILSTETGSNLVEVPFNRQELADYLAVNRSALSAELAKLEAMGYIDYYKNKFTLKNGAEKQLAGD